MQHTEQRYHVANEPPGSISSFFRMLRWELRLELRNIGTVIVLLPYAGTLAVLFHYSLQPMVFEEGKNLMGLLLISLFFMVSMMTARALGREKESGAFRILLMSGMDRTSYFISRVVVKSSMIMIMLLVYSVLYNVLLVGTSQFFRLTGHTLLFLLPCTINLVLLGEIVSILSGANRIREIVLPILFFPLSLPIFIVYSGSSAVLEGRANPFEYTLVLLSLILVYAGVGALFFQFMATDEA
jgi:heme exporter protein B